MMNMLFAEMSSSGYWYHDAIMSTWILALRAEGKRSTHHLVVKHYIETNMRPFLEMTDKQFAPSPNIARRWKEKFPDLPEQAWNLRKYEEGDLPIFARYELKREAMHRDATMSQEPLTAYDRPMNSALTPQVQHTTVGSSATFHVDSTAEREWAIIAGSRHCNLAHMRFESCCRKTCSIAAALSINLRRCRYDVKGSPMKLRQASDSSSRTFAL